MTTQKSNNMKKLFILLLILLPAAVLAQDTDGGATPILKTLAQKYKTYSAFKIDYALKVEKEKKTLSSFSGSLITKGNKYYCTFDDQTYYCDGVSLWTYQKSTNEVSIFEYDEDDDNLINPAKLLDGWDKEYRAKFIREEFVDGNYYQIIDLIPLKSKSYYKVRFKINKVKQTIASITLFETDNTTYTYLVNKFIANPTVEDATFVFNAAKYPGVEVNDMR